MDLDANGIWHGYCGGSRMMVDAQGNAESPTRATGSSSRISEAQARHAILGQVQLRRVLDASGHGRAIWHGYCGGSRMMVDAQGNAGPDTSR